MENAPARAWRRLQALDPRLVDGLLVLVLTAAVVAEFVHDGIEPLKLLPLLGTTLPLFWRRRFPIVSYLCQGAALAVFDAPPLVSSLVAFFFGTYSMGLYSRHRRRSLAVPVGQAAILAAVGIPFHFYTPALPAWVAVLVVGEAMWLAGNSVRGLDERARRLERERDLRIEVVNAAGRPGPHATGAGRGLLGMKQRVSAYGGELQAGPDPEGDSRSVPGSRCSPTS